MATMNALDAMFMVMEARERPAHVGGLQLFTPPDGADDNLVAQLHAEAIRSPGELRGVFAKRPHLPGGIGPWSWTTDDAFDIEYHVRHSSLGHPGRIRELLALVGRLHGTLLDRNRPLWEVNLIEGLDDGRFAIYTKVHHALLDGISAMRILLSSMSTDPDERDIPFPWERREDGSSSNGSSSNPAVVAAQFLRDLPGALTGASITAMRTIGNAFLEGAAELPYKAPRTMFNVPITGARRFAAQSWPIARIRAAGRRHGATINDMVLAMSGGALRAYLLEHGALPDAPLIAMVPVSLKARARDTSTEGNQVGALLCNLGTDLADPQARLEAVQASMSRGKQAFKGMSPLQVLMLTALQLAPAALPTLGLGSVEVLKPFVPPIFNIVISNVPGSRRPLYWNGARMDGSYPVSILVDGQALNITVSSYAGNLDVGIVGDRRAVPSMQRLLVHLEDELSALEA